MELEVKSVEDFGKLSDWKIVSLTVIKSNAPNFFRLRLSHPAAEIDITLDFSPVVVMQVMGNVVTAIPDVRFQVNDAEDE